jgi:hypothetical protein
MKNSPNKRGRREGIMSPDSAADLWFEHRERSMTSPYRPATPFANAHVLSARLASSRRGNWTRRSAGWRHGRGSGACEAGALQESLVFSVQSAGEDGVWSFEASSSEAASSKRRAHGWSQTYRLSNGVVLRHSRGLLFKVISHSQSNRHGKQNTQRGIEALNQRRAQDLILAA